MEQKTPRDYTHQVSVGGVTLGGGAPVRVQSMLTAPTKDALACLEQINSLVENGCELVRAAIPSSSALEGFSEICKESPIPVIADIHFDYRLAVAAAQNGAAALRINPGNIGSWEKVNAVIDAAKQASIPIRIGINAGSLSAEVSSRQDLTLPQKMVECAKDYVDHFIKAGFDDIVLSAKAHDVLITVETYRELSRKLPSIPLHLGITEAGTKLQGTIKSSVGLGMLLAEGIGDTLRVSLTAEPKDELPVAWGILQALGLRRRGAELISCPTCARCRVNLFDLAQQVEERLQTLRLPISVAVMGCEVNGPGEAKNADIGVACGLRSGTLFAHGEILRQIPEESIVDELFKEIALRFNNRP
ncbi:MAG: flavodoxin-dependent (E)-4-hydroxy-3-methylbut-2-enyl-diphosphate synthase [Coriobacteriales bacterium]|nr:flavodoxin-dependent (E)-4-hydroxy-3-methylbut-2-enyl-diphosphate synthase [Coriobacteriales bacterium]